MEKVKDGIIYTTIYYDILAVGARELIKIRKELVAIADEYEIEIPQGWGKYRGKK